MYALILRPIYKSTKLDNNCLVRKPHFFIACLSNWFQNIVLLEIDVAVSGNTNSIVLSVSKAMDTRRQGTLVCQNYPYWFVFLYESSNWRDTRCWYFIPTFSGIESLPIYLNSDKFIINWSNNFYMIQIHNLNTCTPYYIIIILNCFNI